MKQSNATYDRTTARAYADAATELSTLGHTLLLEGDLAQVGCREATPDQLGKIMKALQQMREVCATLNIDTDATTEKYTEVYFDPSRQV